MVGGHGFWCTMGFCFLRNECTPSGSTVLRSQCFSMRSLSTQGSMKTWQDNCFWKLILYTLFDLQIALLSGNYNGINPDNCHYILFLINVLNVWLHSIKFSQSCCGPSNMTLVSLCMVISGGLGQVKKNGCLGSLNFGFVCFNVRLLVNTVLTRKLIMDDF